MRTGHKACALGGSLALLGCLHLSLAARELPENESTDQVRQQAYSWAHPAVEAFLGMRASRVQKTKLAAERRARTYTLLRPAPTSVASNSIARMLQDIGEMMAPHAGLLQAFTKAFLMVRVYAPPQHRAVQYGN